MKLLELPSTHQDLPNRGRRLKTNAQKIIDHLTEEIDNATTKI